MPVTGTIKDSDITNMNAEGAQARIAVTFSGH